MGSKCIKHLRVLDRAATWLQFTRLNFIDSDIARDLKLPTGLIDRKSRGSLMYPCPQFFVENLSVEALVLRGNDIVHAVTTALKEAPHVRAAFDK